MPDLGQLTRDRLPHALALTSPAYPPPPWPLPGARVLKIVFETDAATLLKWLPHNLGRTSPAYAIVTAAHYPESPVGPFSLATQYLGCRATMFIRAFVLHAVTDSERVLSALREVWGFPARLGRVRMTTGIRTARATVAVDGRRIANLRLARGEDCEPGLVRFDPMLNVRLVPSLKESKRRSLLEMVQIDPDHTVRHALRGRGTLSYPEAAEGAPWHLVPCFNVISAAYCEMDTELPLARFIMPF